MSDAESNLTIAAWYEPRFAPLIESVLARLEHDQIVALGSPRKSDVAPLAESFDAEPLDDLRRLVIDHQPSMLLLAGTSGVNGATIEEARQRGVRILAVEPIADRVEAPDAETVRSGGAGLPIITPWWRMCPAWLSAAEPHEAVGAAQAARVSSLGPASEPSLFARLFDAFDLLVYTLGAPAVVDAALVGAEAPEDLRSATGDLTAHIRFASGAAAVLHASDRAVDWRREFDLIGREGQLQLTDHSYRLTGPDGAELDADADPITPNAADLMLEQIQRIASGRSVPRLADPGLVLGCCRAALLSARTEQPESPQTLAKMR